MAVSPGTPESGEMGGGIAPIPFPNGDNGGGGAFSQQYPK